MENVKSFLQALLILLVIVLIGYNIYTGATVQKIGIPDLLEIEFGPPRDSTPEAQPSPQPALKSSDAPSPEPPDTPAPTRRLPTAIPPQESPPPTPKQSTPTPAPQILSCSEPQGTFHNLWIKHKDKLGCPIRMNPLDGLFAEQPFQNGHMFWSKNDKLFLVIIGNDTWLLFGEDESPWKEGMPDVTCNEEVIRGFGGLWCSNSYIQEQLGWSTDKERGFDNGVDLIQRFDNGIIFRDSDGKTRGLAYVLFYDGSFVREPY